MGLAAGLATSSGSRAKRPKAGFTVLVEYLYACPAAIIAFAYFTSHAAATKGVDHKVTGLCEHTNEVFWKFRRESCRMRTKPPFFAVPEIKAVALGVWNRNEVRRDSRAVVDAELIADVMA